MIEQLAGQAAGQQPFAGLVPVQVDQLMKTPGLLLVIEKGDFAQLQLARFAVEQGHATQSELLLADIHVGQANGAIDHPCRLMIGGQHAKFTRRPRCSRLLTAKGPGAARDVARQGVVRRRLIVAGIVMVGPQGCGHAVTELGTVLQTGIGRAAHGLKNLQGIECRHGDYSNALHPTPSHHRCQPRTHKSARICKCAPALHRRLQANSRSLP